ncbi:MAG TPA: cache domain-containing protein [Opitutaceae bacterium]|nr:cache domain-containing protein [Opitutaceae bacterium]HND62370.1 cache domain-containing protein [Opitutaceae bacterium]
MRVPFLQRLPVRLAGLILILGFVLVPLISEFERRAAERIVLQQAELQSATATIAVVKGLQDTMRAVESAVKLVAQDLENRTLTATEADRLIQTVMANSPALSEFGLTFERGALDARTERFGHHLYRSGSHLTLRDLAAPDYQYWTRDWYTDALTRGGAMWTEPGQETGGSNSRLVRVTAPFYQTRDGRRVVAGVVTAGLTLDWVRQLMLENEFFDSGYVIVYSRSGRIITHPDPKVILVETMETLAQKTQDAELGQIFQRTSSNRQGSVSYLSHSLGQRVHENYKPVQLGGWGVIVGYEEKEFLRQVTAFRWITLVSLGATLVVLVVIVLWSARVALRPLGRLTEVAAEISRGNLDSPPVTPERDDEVGLLARTFAVMQAALKRNRELEQEVQRHADELAATNSRLKSEVLERRWSNQALEHQLRYDQLIINAFTDPVIVCTKALNISRVNSAAVRLSGRTAADLINSPLAALLRLDEGGAPDHPLASLATALKEGRDVRGARAVLLAQSGETIHVRVTLFPIRDQDKVVGGVSIFHLETTAPRAS